MAPIERVLLIRMDKLGDLVLSISCDQLPILQGRHVTWLVSANTGFIPAHSLPRRNYFESARSFSWRNLFSLVGQLRELQPDLAIVLHGPWWLGLALWLGGVKKRGGRLSQWHSFLFFNCGVRQSRKGGERHESAYNEQLVAATLAKLVPRKSDNQASELSDCTTEPSIPAAPPLKLQAPTQDLGRFSLTPQNYVVVHPGMAGSALNWPAFRYAELIKNLVPQTKVVITGTALDNNILEQVRAELGEHCTKVQWLNEKLNQQELLAVLAQAKAVVAPSTGVLHLAAALGQAVVGLYSPVAVQRPTRWGARGPRVKTLLGTDAHPPRMEDITPRMVTDALTELGVSL